MVIFQYNLYIFVWIQHSCLTNNVYAMDPNNSYKEVVVYIVMISLPKTYAVGTSAT